MRIGLCILVKNEINQIEACLNDIIDLFEDVIIIDTGSTDGTPDLIRDRFGIEPIFTPLPEDQCYSLGHVRNQGIAKLETPWILSLDADERIERSQLESLVQQKDPADIDGYFCPWPTYHGAELSYLDYKLPLFRNHIKRVGLVHDNVQLDIRSRQSQAIWQDQLVLKHYPEFQRKEKKTQFYLDRLFCALKQDPQGYRYYWFIGYTFFQAHKYEQAIDYLSIAADSHSHQFPVECLNSKMVLAEIQSQQGKQAKVRQTLLGALAFYENVANDFEVQVNFRLKPWLEEALERCDQNQLNDIRAYTFAY